MCQYFWIPAGETVDEEKLRASVIVNPHGWGMVFRPKPKGKGPWPFEKIAWAKKDEDTDPDIIIKMVNEDYKNYDRLLHLRYVTKGELNKSNTHPFLVHSSEGGKQQVWMAHNGTLYSFAPSATDKDTRSDTKVFADEFLAPIFNCLKNPADVPSPIIDAIDTKVTGHNRVILVTSTRRYPVVFNADKHYVEWIETNKIDKKTKEKITRVAWLAANSYSFNADHRKPKTTTTRTYNNNNVVGYWSSASSGTREYSKTVVLAAKAFPKSVSSAAGDDWSSAKLKEFNKIFENTATVWKSIQYMEGYTIFKLNVTLSPLQQRKYNALVTAGEKEYKDTLAAVRQRTVEEEDKGKKKEKETKKKKEDEPYERFSMAKVTVTGDFVYRWPPSAEDYRTEAQHVEAIDPYTKFIYPKVRMFFDADVSDMKSLSRPHGVRTWLVNNRKHFSEEDLVKFIVSMSKTIERMFEDIEVLEDLLVEEGKKSYEKDENTDAISKYNHQYGLM